ncbi:hypothetical protein FJD32_003460 [Shewanella sp. LC6]|jgi:hypothetical protein|nr:hypothetical protein FJD32_003460 [Shewanella sp. LC6]TPE65229.1 hypothetical protein FJD33_01030 [Shewanella sp. LC2]
MCSKESKLSVGKLSKFILGGVVFVVASYAIFLLWITWPISSLTIGQAGVFGDSFGIVTSMFSGLAFAGMIITILLQREELRLQREELKETRLEISEQKKIFKIQNFNESFYRLLEFHKRNLSELSVLSDDAERLKGIDALRFLLGRLKKSYSSYGFQGFKNTTEDEKTEMAYALFVEIQTTLARQSRYLETITSIFTLIESQLESQREKEIYLDLFASQLTVYEIKYIFYQCLVSDPNDSLREYVHNANLFSDRGPHIGVSNTHRDIYTFIHKIEIPKAKSKFHVPFDRKKIRNIKKKNRLRKETHNKASLQDAA